MKPFASSATQPSSQPVLGTAPVMTKTWLMFSVSTAPGLVVPPAHALEAVAALERRRSPCACAARSPGCPRCAESDSATCSRPDRRTGRACARAWPSAPGTRRPDRRSCRRRRRSLLRRRTTALRRRSRRSTRPRLRTATGSRSASLRYSAPVAMMTVRAGTRGPSSISMAYGLRSHVEPRGAFRDHDLRAELLRLRVRAAGELLARNAGRETEIVLDPRARAGLAARRVRLQDQHVQPFRRAVDRRREPRRPGADDDDVADVRLVDRVVEARGSRRSADWSGSEARRRRGRSAPARPRRRRGSDRAAPGRRRRGRGRCRRTGGRCASGTP